MLPGATQEILASLSRNGLHELPQLAETLHSKAQETQRILTNILGSPAFAREWAQVLPHLSTGASHTRLSFTTGLSLATESLRQS